jgi:hypothetical protein
MTVGRTGWACELQNDAGSDQRKLDVGLGASHCAEIGEWTRPS